MFEYSKYSIIHEIYVLLAGCLKKRNVLKVWMHFAKCDINFTILGDASSLMFMH